MQGIILNEDGYVTYPAIVFKAIEKSIKSLMWRVTNVECCGKDYFRFPFEDGNNVIIDGEELYNLIQAHPQIQFVWGVFSGYPKDLSVDIINGTPIVDIQNDLSFLKKELSHIDNNSILEIVAFDGCETYVLCDDDEVIKQLEQTFTNAESLTKYVY
jgi:hypothetical protein